MSCDTISIYPPNDSKTIDMVDDEWSDVYCMHPPLQGSGNSSHYTLFGRPHASVQSLRKKCVFCYIGLVFKCNKLMY